MENDQSLRVLLVAEGSGGHLIPALQVAHELALSGARVKVWFAERRKTAPLADALIQEFGHASIEVAAIPMQPHTNLMSRLWQCGQLWSQSQRCFETFAPDVVVGFGGWVSAPVVLAAHQRHIGCMLHEQNVQLGRANRLLARWADRLAISFPETRGFRRGTPSVLTGMPIRRTIRSSTREQAAPKFGFQPAQPTLLVLGGSQGARFLNRLLLQTIIGMTPEEQRGWQLLHVTGLDDEQAIRSAYAGHRLRAFVAPFLTDMSAAYALADVVISRAGASTIAELAECAKPAILIPYPYAGGHQRANAHLVENISGGVVLEEATVTPERLLGVIRRILGDARLRAKMADQMQRLAVPDAAVRLRDAITHFHDH